MAGNSRSKRTRKDEEMEHDGDEDGGETELETMQVEFEGRKPEDFHYNGLCTLLHQVFLKLNVNVSNIADWIIKHNEVGAVLQQLEPSDEEADDDDDDISDDGVVVSVTSVVNITSEQEKQFAHQLKTLLLERCPPESKKKFTEILMSADHQVGLLVNERLIGLPPHVAVFESLWKDLEKAKKKEPQFNFSYYLLFSKTLRPLIKTSKQKQKGTSAFERHFMNVEEELFYKHSIASFDFSMKDQHDASLGGDWNDEDGESYEPLRTVMIVAADKIPEIMSHLALWIASNN